MRRTRPCLVAHIALIRHKIGGQIQRQGQRMLSNAISAVALYILNGNTSLFAVITVDIVHAGRSYTNIAQLTGLL